MKYKKLTDEQIKISIDRISRFKNTKEKYFRVFTEIIISNLIEPKFKKKDLYNLSAKELLFYVEKIFNNSLPPNIENDYIINESLKNYENSIFVNDEYVNDLLSNHINYKSALSYLSEDSPVNSKWLFSLSSHNNLVEMRETHFLKFPIEKVVLVEGITEEILLPAFSKFLRYDFYQKGVQVIPAGGKNQVVKKYYELIEQLKIPIFLLLDKDAEDNIKQILPKLRSIDKIHLVKCGEFEDLLPLDLMIKTINNQFENFSTVSCSDFDRELSTVKNLENIFKQKGLHEFKKADFAKSVRNNITSDSNISSEIKDIIKELSIKNKSLDSQFCSW